MGGGSTRPRHSSQFGDATGHAASWGKEWEPNRRQHWGGAWGCSCGAAPLRDRPPAQLLQEQGLKQKGSLGRQRGVSLWGGPRPPSLLAYLHEDFAQRYERRAQLCCEDAAHEEVPQLSPEVLQTKAAVSISWGGGREPTPSISRGSRVPDWQRCFARRSLGREPLQPRGAPRRPGSTAAVPSPHLGDGGEHDEDEEVVGHHQPLLQEEAPHAGQRVLLLRDSPVPALVPVAEVHDVNVVGHVGHEDPDVLHGQPVPGEEQHTQRHRNSSEHLGCSGSWKGALRAEMADFEAEGCRNLTRSG